MRVIKKGTPRAARLWEGTCHGCKSVMEAKESEVVPYAGPDPKNEGPFAHATCPVCGESFVLYPINSRQ